MPRIEMQTMTTQLNTTRERAKMKRGRNERTYMEEGLEVERSICLILRAQMHPLEEVDKSERALLIISDPVYISQSSENTEVDGGGVTPQEIIPKNDQE